MSCNLQTKNADESGAGEKYSHVFFTVPKRTEKGNLISAMGSGSDSTFSMTSSSSNTTKEQLDYPANHFLSSDSITYLHENSLALSKDGIETRERYKHELRSLCDYLLPTKSEEVKNHKTYQINNEGDMRREGNLYNHLDVVYKYVDSDDSSDVSYSTFKSNSDSENSHRSNASSMNSAVAKARLRETYGQSQNKPLRRTDYLKSQGSYGEGKEERILAETEQRMKTINLNGVSVSPVCFSESGPRTKSKKCYYVDEEQPTDTLIYSMMVNDNDNDIQLLPAVIETIELLRESYHDCLVEKYRSRRRGNSLRFGLSGNQEERLHRKDTESNTYNKDGGWKRGVTPNGSYYYKHKEEVDNNLTISSPMYPVSQSTRGYKLFYYNKARRIQLHGIAAIGNVSLLQQMVVEGCEIDALDSEGWPALHSALRSFKFRCAIFLLEIGSDTVVYTKKRLREYRQVINKARKYCQFLSTQL